MCKLVFYDAQQYIKTGAPVKVEYQIGGPQMPYNLVMRDLTCDV